MQNRVPSLISALSCAICACASKPIAVFEESSDTAAADTASAESDTSEPEPEPDCPAQLGELVECECGFVEGCTLESASGEACFVACEGPASCEDVICNFDWAHGEPACVQLASPDGLDCVLDALVSGADAQVSLTLDNTYPFVGWTERRTFISLGTGNFLVTRNFDEFYDAGPVTSSQWDARVIVVTDADLQACANGDFAEARFECLFDLWASADLCAEPQSLTCGP